MDFFSIIGLIAGVFVLVQGILSNGTLRAFYDLGSIYITVGGTITALIVNFPLKNLKLVFPAIGKALFSKPDKPEDSINVIVELAEHARKNGLISLEEKVKEYKNEFLQKGIMSIIDTHDSEKVRDILETQLSYIEDRHAQVHTILEKGASYGPAFGMIGTLIGLINMLKDLSKDMTQLGPNMSVALVTTFYGSVLANVIFLPLAGKLKIQSENEIFCKQLIIEGVIAIQAGENPRLIRERLSGNLSSGARKKGQKRTPKINNENQSKNPNNTPKR